MIDEALEKKEIYNTALNIKAGVSSIKIIEDAVNKPISFKGKQEEPKEEKEDVVFELVYPPEYEKYMKGISSPIEED